MALTMPTQAEIDRAAELARYYRQGVRDGIERAAKAMDLARPFGGIGYKYSEMIRALLDEPHQEPPK